MRRVVAFVTDAAARSRFRPHHARRPADRRPCGPRRRRRTAPCTFHKNASLAVHPAQEEYRVYMHPGVSSRCDVVYLIEIRVRAFHPATGFIAADERDLPLDMKDGSFVIERVPRKSLSAHPKAAAPGRKDAARLWRDR